MFEVVDTLVGVGEVGSELADVVADAADVAHDRAHGRGDGVDATDDRAVLLVHVVAQGLVMVVSDLVTDRVGASGLSAAHHVDERDRDRLHRPDRPEKDSIAHRAVIPGMRGRTRP